MKLKFFTIPILCLLFILIPVKAEVHEEGIDIRIKNNTVKINGYVITDFAGKVPSSFINNTDETISSNPIKCNNINVTEGNVTKTYQTNCTLNLDYHKEIPFSFNRSVSTIIGNTDLQRKYEDCLVLKSQFSAGLDSCSKAKVEQGEFEKNFTQCSTGLQICRSEKSSIETNRNDLKKEMEDNKNKHWIWGIGGLVIGVAGILLYQKKLLGPKVKSPEDSYNTRQAG
jgi:hypothetical protein